MVTQKETLFKFKNDLPILQDFMPTANSEIVPYEELDSKTNTWKWRKGELATNRIFQFGLLAGGGYALYKLLPFILLTIQNLIYALLLGGVLIVIIAMIPVFKRWLRLAIRKAHEAIIEYDPISNLRIYLEEYKQKGVQFQQVKTQIKAQKNNLSKEAFSNQDKAEQFKNDLEIIKSQVQKLDPNNKAAKIQLSGEFQNKKLEFENAKQLAEGYAIQAKQVEKAALALDMAQAHLTNKIKRLEITIDSAEKRFKFAKNAALASSVANQVLKAEDQWEIGYALNFIEDSIQYDLALFGENMNSIVNNVGSANMNVDAVLASIDNLNLDVRSVDSILDSSYDLTSKDKNKSGINMDALDNLFN